jgi:hypothetical protein
LFFFRRKAEAAMAALTSVAASLTLNTKVTTTNKKSNFTFSTKWQGDLLFGTYIRERITEHHLSVCPSFFLSCKTSSRLRARKTLSAAAAAAVIVVVCSLLPFKNWILGCVWGFQDSVTMP